MFECKYKFELEDSLISAKYVYNSQKRKQDKIIAFLIPILILAMVGMLVYDIISGKSLVWDVILLIALLVLQITYLIIPLMLVSSQKKAYKKQNISEMDYLLIKIENNICTEALYKNEKEVSKNVHNLKFLTSYLEDNKRLILVFNKVEYICLRKEFLNCEVSKLKEYLNKIMAKK